MSEGQCKQRGEQRVLPSSHKRPCRSGSRARQGSHASQLCRKTPLRQICVIASENRPAFRASERARSTPARLLKAVCIGSTSLLPRIIFLPCRKVLLEPFLWGRCAGSVERRRQKSSSPWALLCQLSVSSGLPKRCLFGQKREIHL